MNYPGHIIQRSSVDASSVTAIKHALNARGFGPLDEKNPTFGATTEATVKAFQKDNQLIQDGEVGLLTWTRLFNVDIVEEPKSLILRLRAVEIADTQLFVRELTGHNDGREVKQYLNSVGLGEGFAWCMSFVYWCFMRAAAALNIANPVPRTGGVLSCLQIAKSRGYKIIDDDPQPGDQGILDFGAGKGHTFLVNELKPGKRVFTVEGNTSADPSYKGEDREGNGVFERNRAVDSAIAYIRYF
jgi:hypothetical protein